MANKAEERIDDKTKVSGWLSSFGFTIHEVLRYGYGGMLVS
jgi:hypothetical protein